jgi:signal transduction histidine kinase/ActR/RegA family two-component response regulator
MVARYLNDVEKQWSESRIRLQLAREAADLGIHDFDMVRGTIQWDERVQELWNVGPRQPITRETFWTAVHPEDRASTKAAMDLALDPSGNGRYAVEFRTIPGVEGEPRWIEARGRTIFERGRAVRLVGTVQDITGRKQGEAELREAHERLRRWNADLEQAVNVKTAELIQSQERLRALASELSLTEQRERTRLATELHDHLQQLLVLGKLEIGQGKRFAVGSPACEKVMKRVDDILSDSLTYSRTLVAELSPPVLRDHGLAAGLKWLAEYMSKRHEQTVTVLVPEEDLRLPEDQRILLFQSVRELLINSSKYAGTGEAAVEMIQSENQVRIEVRDQGAGFDLTADASAVGTPSGGISSKFGLFSIRERMHALGGSCVIESAPGQGTRATLRLPLAQSGQKTVESEQWGMPGGEGVQSGEGAKRSPFKDSPPATHHSTLQKNGLIRVLLVDDHAMVRQGLRSVLDAYADIQVVGEAQDGSEAVRLAEELRPRVVVMDINMPTLNGIEATERIKTQWPGTVVIGISVNTGDANGQAMKQAGAAGLIAKDAAVDELYALIRRETTDAAQFEISTKAR